jgi:serine protease
VLGGRLIAAAAVALAVSAPAIAAAAPSPAVLVTAAPADADALGPAARPALPAASLDRLERRAGRRLPELRRLYRLEAPGAAAARRLAGRLDARPGVEAVVAPPPPPPAVCREEPPGGWPALDPAAATPDLSPFQDYRLGLGIPDGAAGAGVRVADIEYDWRRTHEELGDRGLPAPVLTQGGLADAFRAEEHGTAVLGILGADDDASGITGLAQAAEIEPLSPFFQPNPAAYDPLRAALDAFLRLRPGDVLLIEQQTLVGSPSNPVFAPIEVLPPMRDLIRAIVDAGVVVVEPAGNGNIDLAGLNLPWLAGPGDPADSGALIVGAGGSPSAGTDLARTTGANGSNYGARVDVQGFGAGVLTSGYGEGIGTPEPKDRAYTSCFDGTSSASATVAGAVAALQGLARATRGAPLTPTVVRSALVATGVPQPDVSQPIGPRPQVSAAAALVGAVAPPATAEAPAAAPASGPAAARPARPSAPSVRPAARGASGRLDRRAGTLTITLRGLAPRAIVFVGGRRVRVVRDRVVLDGVRPRRFLLVVSAPSTRRLAYALAGFRVVVRARGPVRITRL